MTIKHLYPTSRPSLDLNFARDKKLDPRITYSRSSSGTYYDAAGVLQSAATNVARFDHDPVTKESLGLLVEEARTNLVTYSEQFNNAAWTRVGTTIITPNTTVAPDGTITASTITMPATSDWVWQSTGAAAGVSLTFSVFLAGTGSIYISVYDNISGTQTKLISLTSTLTRYSLTFSFGAGSTDKRVSIANRVNNGNTTTTVIAWGAQLEAGSFPTSYIPTPATFTGRTSTATYYDANGVIQTALSGVARSNAYFPDSNGVMRSAGLLLEAAGTNQVTASVPTGTSPWSVSALTTVNTNATTAPDGTNTGTLVAADAGNTGNAYVEISFTSIPTECTVSFFAKDAGVGGCSGLINTTNGQWTFSYNFSTGATTVSNSTYLTKVRVDVLANSWRRISITISGTNTTFVRLNARASWGGTQPNGNSSTGVYFWGVQAEAGSNSTSYIPTSGSTVTRAADTSTSATVTRSDDVVSITGTNFSSWYNQGDGTFFVNLLPIEPAAGNAGVGCPFLTLPNGFMLQSRMSSSYALTSDSPSFNTVTITPTNNLLRFSIGISADGSTAISRSSSLPVVTGFTVGTSSKTSLLLGSGTRAGTWTANGTGTCIFSRLTYHPVRLSDTTLQTITK